MPQHHTTPSPSLHSTLSKHLWYSGRELWTEVPQDSYLTSDCLYFESIVSAGNADTSAITAESKITSRNWVKFQY